MCLPVGTAISSFRIATRVMFIFSASLQYRARVNMIMRNAHEWDKMQAVSKPPFIGQFAASAPPTMLHRKAAHKQSRRLRSRNARDGGGEPPSVFILKFQDLPFLSRFQC